MEPVSASVSRTSPSSLKAFPIYLRLHLCLTLPMPVALGAPDKSMVLPSFLGAEQALYRCVAGSQETNRKSVLQKRYPVASLALIG